ncbi:MAG TPA: hypothetical protein VJ725_13915 [Thermoanaerobaculia bacterium]|nr:hypothetical protein [Thermoanaerobaculia bacterium]
MTDLQLLRRDFIRLAVLSFPGLYLLGTSRSASAAGTFALKAGETFTFSSQKGEGKAGGALADAQGAIIQDPLPSHQTVKVIEVGDCKGKKCITLQADRDIPPPSPDLAKEKFSEKMVASIDAATGEILHLSSTVSGGGSVSTSTQDQFGRTVTIADFYGPWMLDVDDKYKKSGGNGSISLTLETVGRGKFQGYDCFQVRKTLSMSGKKVVRTYWIDTQRRIALKVEEQGGTVLSLTKAGDKAKGGGKGS